MNTYYAVSATQLSETRQLLTEGGNPESLLSKLEGIVAAGTYQSATRGFGNPSNYKLSFAQVNEIITALNGDMEAIKRVLHEIPATL